jgi:hypothetical protein
MDSKGWRILDNKKKSDKEDAAEAAVESAEAFQDGEEPSKPEITGEDITTEAPEQSDDTAEDKDPDAQDAELLPENPAEEQADPEADDVATEDVDEGENIADDTEPEAETFSNEDAEEPVIEPEEIVEEPEPERVAPSPAPEPQKTAGVGTMLAGGIFAGVIGYLLASANLLPAPWKAVDPAIAELKTQIEAQSEAMTDSLEELRGMSQPADLSPLEAGLKDVSDSIAGLDGRLTEVDAAIAGLNERIEALEARPIAENGAAMPAPVIDLSPYEAQLAALEETVKTQRAEVEAVIAAAKELDEQAAAAQKRAAIQAGVARLQAALEQGTPFQSIIDDLSAAGADVPDALSAAAGDGVATLSQLRSGYPDAARNALAEVRSGEKTAGSIGAFLQRQLGARSVEPREGDDPDAVLSRIEASLSSGDLASAVQQVDVLPDAAKTALSDWTALARQRLTAQEAIDELAAGAAEN